jgi:hypothetical protein
VGKRSFKVAVLAREGRGGGDVPAIPLDAKGSCSVSRGEGPADDKLCLRGFGFCKELRTLGEAGGGDEVGGWDSVGVFDLKDDKVGGGGGGLEGMKGVYLAASAACRLASARRALYSWIDSLDGL